MNVIYLWILVYWLANSGDMERRVPERMIYRRTGRQENGDQCIGKTLEDSYV